MFENFRRRTSKWLVSSSCKVGGCISYLILNIGSAYPFLLAHSLFSRSPQNFRIGSERPPSLHSEVGAKTFHKLPDIKQIYPHHKNEMIFYVSAALLVPFLFFLLCLSISAKFAGSISNTTSPISLSLQIVLFCRVLSALDLLNLPR